MKENEMNKLRPRIQIVWIVSWFFLATALGAVLSILDNVWLGFIYPLGLPVFLTLFFAGTVHSILRYRIWRYQIREDSLYLKRGVITRVHTVVPFSRLQHVDTQRAALERLMGLSTLVVYTAGSRGADVSIPGLKPEEAEELQGSLKDKTMEFELGGEDAV